MSNYTTETKDYYECERCGVTTATENRLCPCNRRVCDAVKKGTLKITKTITLDGEGGNSNQLFNDDIGQMIASMNL